VIVTAATHGISVAAFDDGLAHHVTHYHYDDGHDDDANDDDANDDEREAYEASVIIMMCQYKKMLHRGITTHKHSGWQ